MSSEVSIDEILDKYRIKVNYERVTGWLVDVTLTDLETNAQHDGALSWNEHFGYQFDLHNPASETLRDLMDRPEFEYSLDCIIHDGG
jgi:hypothetical protein